MGNIRSRGENGKLFFDFRFRGKRCREQTTLENNPTNMKQLRQIMDRIEAEITLGTFVYRKYFPNSPMVDYFDSLAHDEAVGGTNPPFRVFAWQWYEENQVQWKESYRKTIQGTLSGYLEPQFGGMLVNRITKSEILSFRSALAKESGRNGKQLSADRINHIMTPLRMILTEAADRYHFTNPWVRIKPLAVPRIQIDPFTLDEVTQFLGGIRQDYRPYYTVRFFTGLRTGEIDGLKWEYVDMARRIITIHETVVNSRPETPKCFSSYREVQMSTRVLQAFKEQWHLTGKLGGYVFCSRNGTPLAHRNVTKRVWYPALEQLGLKRRRPYQTRHTAATLWLGAGENPEWISRQLGHANTRMLFERYSRFVPNLTRQDGSAFELMLQAHMTTSDKPEKTND